MEPLSRRAIFAQAWPIILGQALVPLVGIVDATVIGRTGDAGALAGVALGVTVINLVFWTFGFLRMGVTGLTAQAKGAGDMREVPATLLRGLVLGVAIGALLLAFSGLIVPAALALMSVPEQAERAAHAFTAARFFGAPGALGFYVINGWLLGMGRTRLALGCQLLMNGLNIALDLLFVSGLHMGALGVGIGTALAEWSALGVGLIAVHRVLGAGWWRMLKGEGLFAFAAMRRLIAVNLDIMIRTLALLILFTWFARAGARLGAVPLAANHVLMQFVSVSAFVLDGFAFTAEARVGAAVGAGSRTAFLRAVRLTGEFSLAGGLVFTLLIALGGSVLIDLVTRDPAVRAQAAAMLPWCALIPLLGAPSWLLDGIFIGATRGRVLRNAAVAVTVAYLATDAALRGLGDVGVWAALLASYVYRALSLGMCLPGLVRRVERVDPAFVL
ncbi:MATE family efflux transporter [Sphingomonas oligoaromativorans]|uniref:MATE family efflux transporter n=1 Tax=Sphingomonas oligoaromativorans TaxID=575322 RepID=UPI0014225BC5|nr:MATE family efflux transporter [Sphingomonas oligoaromativorans]NIJ34251.1 MATE family multidrug resistance protein [Sphingomonas oligoaromativorans]